MSQTVVWPANLGTTVRRTRSSGATAGQGQSKRWYVGATNNFDFDAFVRFAPSWVGVGRIVSAILTIYTDDGLGDMPSTTTEHPHAVFKRLTSAFAEGNAPDGTWQTNDYTAPTATASDQRSVDLTRETMGLNSIDITAMAEDWAPSTVKRRDGTPGGKASHYGVGIYGSSDQTKNIGLISDKWTDAAFRPVITLTFEYGPTVPDAPTNVAPSGAVASLVDFQGDFTDSQRPTDTLKQSTVQVFDAGRAISAISAATNNVSLVGHGFSVNDVVYFTSLTGGVGLTTFTGYRVRVVTDSSHFTLKTLTGTAEVDITTLYTAAVLSKLLYSGTKDASGAEIDADRFTHVPDNLATLSANTTYRWRSRVVDNEGQVSPYTSLVSFSFTNTAPTAPVLSPVSASTFVNPDAIPFRGTFADADAGDQMIAYQVQMSAYPEGDARWDDDQYILWNTGKTYITPTTDPFETPYGGASLNAGTYYWRARVFDSKSAPSNWTYASIIFTSSFESDPTEATVAIQLRPRAPWRIVIKDMGALRGPGNIVAILEDAKNVGASEMYNSPGELHFTLPVDHPQLAVIEPKQTHYSVQFRQGDGWHEVFAGLVDDFDATDTDIIFYGIDYIGLLDRMVDERYDASNPNKPSERGGSYYITAGKNAIWYVVQHQLWLAKNLSNSPVGFIAITNPASGRSANIANMTETLQVFSTYAPVLQFIVGLLDSHRNGQNKRTRIRVRRTNAGGYEWLVQDNPGQVRDNLRMRYGELVQGYRVVAFGNAWATRLAGIGRAKDGIKVMYKQKVTPGVPEATWGRFTRVQLFDGVSDPADFARRIQQAVVAGGKLGHNVGLGLRSGILQPKDGFDVCDHFPISIEHGSVSTTAFGSGYWTAVGVTWECSAQDGKQNTTISFQPREDATPPSADLLTLQPLSTQAEWQVGWKDPNPLAATSLYWLDQESGKVYIREAGTLVAEGITGTS